MLKLQKKVCKGKGDLQFQLDSVLQDVNDMYLLLEEMEKQVVCWVLIEEWGCFCIFIIFLQFVVNGELIMLGEIIYLQGIIDDLVVLIVEFYKLFFVSEQVIKDLKGLDYSWFYQILFLLFSSFSFWKFSMCSLVQLVIIIVCFFSVFFYDFGFVFQDVIYFKFFLFMFLDIISQKFFSFVFFEVLEICQFVSECSFFILDWFKVGFYEQFLGVILQWRKD